VRVKVRDAVKKRYSCRSYKPDSVDDKVVQELIDNARNAPSASNRQEWRFVVVSDRDMIKSLAERAGTQPWWATAPVMIACCAETDEHMMKCGQLCYPIDCAIIIDHLTLLATEKGLATCWLGAFDEKVVKEVCGIPDDIRVVELLTLGHPADESKPKKRLGVEGILFRNTWGSSY
jgi:nitroreductase